MLNAPRKAMPTTLVEVQPPVGVEVDVQLLVFGV